MSDEPVFDRGYGYSLTSKAVWQCLGCGAVRLGEEHRPHPTYSHSDSVHTKPRSKRGPDYEKCREFNWTKLDDSIQAAFKIGGSKALEDLGYELHAYILHTDDGSLVWEP